MFAWSFSDPRHLAAKVQHVHIACYDRQAQYDCMVDMHFLICTPWAHVSYVAFQSHV